MTTKTLKYSMSWDKELTLTILSNQKEGVNRPKQVFT